MENLKKLTTYTDETPVVASNSSSPPPIQSIDEAAEKTLWDNVPDCVLQAVGFLHYLKHEIDYLPDDIYEWIGKIIHSIECHDFAKQEGAEHQARQPVRKTLDEVKDEVAKEAGYNSWIDFAKWCSLVPTMESYCDKVAQLYASSQANGE